MKGLLEQRSKVFEEGRALILKAETEARALTSDEQVSYDKIMADVESLGATIERSRSSAQMDAELSKSIGPIAAPSKIERRGSDIADAAMDSFLRSGVTSLTTEQRSLFAATPGYRDGIQLRAASPLSDVTGTAGAYTVPAGFVQTLETTMKWYGGARQSGATIMQTTTGQPLPYPVMTDTNNTGELVAENTAISQASTEMSFSHVTFGAYKYSSKLVLVPIELIQDSAFDVQSFVANALGVRLGRIQNTHFTVGTGSGQPTGIVTASPSGLTTASPTAVAYSELVSLTHSVDPAYRIGAKFMFNDATAGYFESLLDANGRPLLNSSFAGVSNDVKAGEPQSPSKYTILGYPVTINNDMASIASTAEPVAFGDFSKYVIRDVMDLMLVRFGENYMANAQIGYVCFMRSDGNSIQPSAIKLLTCHA